MRTIEEIAAISGVDHEAATGLVRFLSQIGAVHRSATPPPGKGGRRGKPCSTYGVKAEVLDIVIHKLNSLVEQPVVQPEVEVTVPVTEPTVATEPPNESDPEIVSVFNILG